MPIAIVLAFGVSGIGQVGASYYQNDRDLAGYYEAIDHGVLPIKRGIALSADDVLRRAVIQALMCQFILDIEQIETDYSIEFDRYFRDELIELEDACRGRARHAGKKADHGDAPGTAAGAQHLHGVRPLPARREGSGTLLESHLTLDTEATHERNNRKHMRTP